MNVCHPFELVPGAFGSGEFPWDPDGDHEREQALTTAADVRRYAVERACGWHGFLEDVESELGDGRRPVTSPRGALSFGDLLAQQRWHAAFHYRQLAAHRREAGLGRVRSLPAELESSLDLPPEVF